MAVVQAGSCSSNMTPSLGTSTCCTCGSLIRKKKKKTQKNNSKFLKILKWFLNFCICTYSSFHLERPFFLFFAKSRISSSVILSGKPFLNPLDLILMQVCVLITCVLLSLNLLNNIPYIQVLISLKHVPGRLD